MAKHKNNDNNAEIIKIKSLNGQDFEFYNEVKAQGGVKDVYMSPSKKYVVAFFRDNVEHDLKKRLLEITNDYRNRIFNQEGGDNLKALYCWPIDVVEYNGKIGVVVPFYDKDYFFKYGSINDDKLLKIRGKEKQGKWFATPKNRKKRLDPRELGDWRQYLRICILLSRAVRRMHMAGLSHSDLGYKNCLIDPVSGKACLIDLDGLVVPGKHPPSVLGTQEFIAPEVVKTSHLTRDDKNRILPSVNTDKHALAVLIYMYLLYRHPLDGDRIYSDDTDEDEKLKWGEKALFIEHPTDKSNRIKDKNIEDFEKPWKDTAKLPYTITGPYLSKLFEKAFIEGLHNPTKRPSASEWENALIKTVDLLQPCQNKNCEQKWYPFDNTKKPVCPFCGTPYKGKLPVIDLYHKHKGKYVLTGHRIMVYSEQSLFKWHIDRTISPNEKIKDADKKRVGYFVFHNNNWYLVNENMPDAYDAKENKPIPINRKGFLLTDGAQILFSKGENGFLGYISMVEN